MSVSFLPPSHPFANPTGLPVFIPHLALVRNWLEFGARTRDLQVAHERIRPMAEALDEVGLSRLATKAARLDATIAYRVRNRAAGEVKQALLHEANKFFERLLGNDLLVNDSVLRSLASSNAARSKLGLP